MERNFEELESVKGFKVETLEIAGLYSVLEALHLPFGGDTTGMGHFESKTTMLDKEKKYNSVSTFVSQVAMTNSDMKLIHTLIKRGDEHGKCIRGIEVYAKMTAPRYWWQEMDTYKVGVTPLGSNSTMHQQCKGMDTYDLVKTKEELPEKTMQTRIKVYSYQTLRRIYFQRRNHRLPQWHQFCTWIESLPFADEFITFEK